MELVSFIVGIVGALGVVGLITLRPQIAVSPGEPLESSGRAFSVPFKITNVGILGLEQVNAFCYLHRVQIGGIRIERGIAAGMEQPARLAHQEARTLECSVFDGSRPSRADIAVVVSFRWLGFRRVRAFRFVGAGDKWQWLAQPAEEIMGDIDTAMAHRRELRRKRG